MTDPFCERLRALIGRHCAYYGTPCRVVEVLAAEGLLILETSDALPPVQLNQYGEAGRRVNALIEVPLLGPDAAPSEDLLHLFEGLGRGAVEAG